MFSFFNQFMMLSLFSMLNMSFMGLFMYSMFLLIQKKSLMKNSIDMINPMNDMFNMENKDNLFMKLLFLLIICVNMMGLFPYIFSLTSQLSMTLGLSFIMILYKVVIKMKKENLNFFKSFVPYNCPMYLSLLLMPLETMSFLISIISLGVRLSANITAGHVLMAIISNLGFLSLILVKWYLLLPLFLLMTMMLLEMFMALIQSYIFMALTMLYMKKIFFMFKMLTMFFANEYNLMLLKNMALIQSYIFMALTMLYMKKIFMCSF